MKFINKHFVILLFCIFTNFFTLQMASYALEPKKTTEQVTGDAKRGAQLFSETCTQCHNSKNTTVPNLKGLFKGQKKLTNGQNVTIETIQAQIKNGSKRMPGYKSKYNDGQVSDLIAHLKTL